MILPRWMYILIPAAVVGMILDFHFGGEIILKTLLETLLFVGQAALTGWLAMVVLSYFAFRVLLTRRKS